MGNGLDTRAINICQIQFRNQTPSLKAAMLKTVGKSYFVILGSNSFIQV